ncbi:uncharacterized protein LOC105161995 isoform X4 [Sesamum indicum]|uniref:Uncharacterized protein LOC105161995 isoform X4 n=1 Tax=Sesamum indicum TaxID=4182 RepID=A0A8M8UQT1_SESIN|nr:uncharacterized protein LOC105161995 isoform X4 [Sesamum indicum]XP_020549298.1 uncharacterized protein LOC105161995 isoform X4 [Sesamum indicum]
MYVTISTNTPISCEGSLSCHCSGWCQWWYCSDCYCSRFTICLRLCTLLSPPTHQLVVKAVSLAIARDGASGGVVRTVTINKDGVTRKFYPGDTLPLWHEEMEPQNSLLDTLSAASPEPMVRVPISMLSSCDCLRKLHMRCAHCWAQGEGVELCARGMAQTGRSLVGRALMATL